MRLIKVEAYLVCMECNVNVPRLGELPKSETARVFAPDVSAAGRFNEINL